MLGGDFGKETFDFVKMEKGNLFFRGARKVDEAGVERMNTTTSKIFKESTKGNEVIGLGEDGEILLSVVIMQTI